MKKWQHVVRDARLVYINRDKFAYLYGANGERPTDYAEAMELINKMWKYYPTHFEDAVIKRGHTKEELARHITGKKCFDCSAFICAVSQYEGDIMTMQVLRDYSSYGLHDAMSKKTSLQLGNWGSVLWRPGHVALDAGNGLAIDFANEFVDVREYRFVDPDPICTFEISGELPWIDYKNAINL